MFLVGMATVLSLKVRSRKRIVDGRRWAGWRLKMVRDTDALNFGNCVEEPLKLNLETRPRALMLENYLPTHMTFCTS